MAKDMNLDPDQEAAYRADENAAVSAGAGSGKTTVLAERYVRLVTQGGLNVSEVLTLTFTRKAAAEMHARIFKRLAESSDPMAQERLAQFDQARIATLDSFCVTILKGASYRYGISGDFKIDEAELRRTAQETAVEIIMRRRKEEPMRRLVAARSFDAVVSGLFADIALKDFSFVQSESYAGKAEKQIAFIKKEFLRCCQSINELGQNILAVKPEIAKSVAAAHTAILSRLPLKPEDPPASHIETAEYFISKDSFKLPGNVTNPELIFFKEIGSALKKEQCPKLRSLAKTLCFEEDILYIGTVFDEYEKLFLDRKRTKGLLSFQDAAQLAVDILTKDIELRTYYKTNIKAVMIDEFQDNNALQKNLLYLIAERDSAGVSGVLPSAWDLAPDKLFFVGDEKQSIYRFRGADVSVFRGLAQELGENRRISLSTNYRSAPELVDFFNALFLRVFGVPQEPFEAEFSAMQTSPKKKPDGKPHVEVFVQEVYRGDQEESAEDEAETAKETSEALTAAKRIITGVETREFEFGEVAVLFRSTTHQNQYERTFREAGIPFSAADPRGLFAEGPANDFYAILRLSLFPADRNAYATVLRSPFAGLSGETVLAILLDNPGEPFPEDPPETWFPNSAEQERYKRGQEIFSQVKKTVDLQGIAPVCGYLWYETGYRTYLLYEEAARPNLEHFEYLYALALDADQRRLTLSAFLDELAPLMGTADKTETGDIPALKNQVLFLTVHKSKGLEFPVAILANAGAESKGSRNDKPYFLDPEFGLAVNFKSDTARRNEKQYNYFYDLRKDAETRQEEAELKRLFYVAGTRAEKKLIIIGSRTVSKKDRDALIDLEPQARLESLIKNGRTDSEGNLQKKSFLDLFSFGLCAAEGNIPFYRLIPIVSAGFKTYKNDVQKLRERTSAFQDAKSPQDSREAFYARFPVQPAPDRVVYAVPSQLKAEYVAPYPPETVLSELESDAFLQQSGEGSEQPEEASVSGGDLQKHFGTLCHYLIQQLIDGTVPKENLQETADRKSRSLFGKNLSEKALKTAAQDALKLAQRFLDSPYGREALLSPRRQTEFPFVLPLKSADNRQVLIHGKIDLLYEHQGRCIIIDFKTDRLLEPKAHQVQLDCYRYAAKAFSDLPVETLLVYLRNTQAVPIDPALSDAELCKRALQNGSQF